MFLFHMDVSFASLFLSLPSSLSPSPFLSSLFLKPTNTSLGENLQRWSGPGPRSPAISVLRGPLGGHGAELLSLRRG